MYLHTSVFFDLPPKKVLCNKTIVVLYDCMYPVCWLQPISELSQKTVLNRTTPTDNAAHGSAARWNSFFHFLFSCTLGVFGGELISHRMKKGSAG